MADALDTDLLTTDETAQRLHTSRRTLYEWRVKAFGPTAFQLGGKGRIVYLASEVERFIDGSWRDAAERYNEIELAAVKPEPLVAAGPPRPRTTQAES